MSEQQSIDRGDVAEFFEVDASEIAETPVNLEALREQGVLVSVSVRGTSMLARRATRAELGMAADDIRVDHLTAGVSYTVPPDQAKAWRNVEGKVRLNLKRFSFEISGFAPKSYLPFTAWDNWLQKHRDLVAEGEGIKLEILRDRQQLVEDMHRRYAEIADRAWSALMSKHPEAATWSRNADLIQPVILPDGKSYHNYHDFARDLLDVALKKLPSEDDIRDGLTIDYQFSLITMMSEVQEELAALAEQQARTAEARAQQAESRSRQHMIADQQAAAKQAADRYVQEQGRVDQANADAEIARINARTRIIEQNIRAQLADMVNPYQEMFEQLRQQIAIDANALLQSLKGGKIKGPTASGARNLIETFRILNIANDTELEALMQKLESRLDMRQPRIPHDVPKLTETLSQIADLCSDEALAQRRKIEAAMRLADLVEEEGAARSPQPISAAPDLTIDTPTPVVMRPNAAPDMTGDSNEQE